MKATNESEPYEDAVAWGIGIPFNRPGSELDIILTFLSKSYAEMICQSIKDGVVVPLVPQKKK